jgi:ion channel-forming bestrophin family protein
MIVPSKKWGWLKILIQIRGTVLPMIWRRVLATTLFAAVLTGLHTQYGLFKITLTPLPFTVMGLALSIFLGFRNSSSYDRFWEGRKLWGQLVNTSRSLARQVLNYLQIQDPEQKRELEAFQKQTIYLQIAYVHSLRLHLRGHSFESLGPWLSKKEEYELQTTSNVPMYIMGRLSSQISLAHRKGWLDPLHLPMLEERVHELSNLQGGCERIRNTPLPFAYVGLMHQLVVLYCFALPFAFSDHWYTLILVAVVSYAFLGLDSIGDSIENPFDVAPNDLPLEAISRTIEINLRDLLGESNLPAPLSANEKGILY